MDINASDLWELSRTVFSYPAIDNHAHAFLREEFRDAYSFEGLITEAHGERALTQDAVQTMACFRATIQLAKLFGLGQHGNWEAVKTFRKSIPYEQLCRMCMEPTHIQCILIDDGLGVSADRAKLCDYREHDQFTSSPTKRIVRVETIAEEILMKAMDEQIAGNNVIPGSLLQTFEKELADALAGYGADPEVVGFKSIACYRTGLDVAPAPEKIGVLERAVMTLILVYAARRTLRLADKALNDYVVHAAMRAAGECGKPVQFHTGLGDNDITLALSSPAHLQPLIKAYPRTKVVLLHSSYPYTREAGYLASVYENVFLDFGEIFPFLSGDGQRDTIRQVLELAPTNKILWSTDGHFWPESYYLGTLQARQALYEVLEASVRRFELTLPQAVGIAKRALFENANRIYNLGLEPHFT